MDRIKLFVKIEQDPFYCLSKYIHWLCINAPMNYLKIDRYNFNSCFLETYYNENVLEYFYEMIRELNSTNCEFKLIRYNNTFEENLYSTEDQ